MNDRRITYKDMPIWISQYLPLSILLSIIYMPLAKWMIYKWQNDMAYSHGFFIPIISIYLIWQKKPIFRNRISGENLWIGLFCIASACLLIIIGRLGAVIQIEALSIFLILPGIIMVYFGTKILKELIFPILYLNFMIPWAGIIIERMHPPFQLLAAKIGTFLIHIYGIPAYLEGKFIQLPNVALVVAEECSGVRFIIAVVAIALPLAYMTQRTYLRAVLVVIVGILITILANSLRVSIAALLAYNFGPELLHGPGHILRGWSVAVVGWIAIFIVNKLIAKINSPKKNILSERWRNRFNSNLEDSMRGFNKKTLLSTLAPVGITAILLFTVAVPKEVAPINNMAKFPYVIEDWKGQDVAWYNKEDMHDSIPDKEISRVYMNSDGKKVYLYIGYYYKQSSGNKVNFGIPNQSINIINRQNLKFDGKIFNVNQTLIDDDKSKYKVNFWYKVSDQYVTSKLSLKISTIINGIHKRENNAALIIVGTKHTGLKGFIGDQTVHQFMNDIVHEVDKNIL